MDRWYVVYSQPRAEARALQNLKNQDFDVYLPRYRKRRRHARRTDVILAPLFPRYLFVRMNIQQQEWSCINGTIGVQYLYCNGDHPVPVPERVIDGIRSRESDDGTVKLSPASFHPGQPLRIVDGPFIDACGLFEEIVDDDRVLLLLSVLGREVHVRMPIESVVVSH